MVVGVPPVLHANHLLDADTDTADWGFQQAHLSPRDRATRLVSGPCNSFHCFGQFKNVYDDDDNDNDELQPC